MSLKIKEKHIPPYGTSEFSAAYAFAVPVEACSAASESLAAVPSLPPVRNIPLPR